MKAHFGKRAQLCFTDTDSLIYKFVCLDHQTSVDEEFFNINARKYPHLEYSLHEFRSMNPEKAKGPFDLSALDIPGRKCPNKKLLGTMKDETGFKRITELIAPLPKQYFIDTMVIPEEQAFVTEAECKDLLVRKGKGIPNINNSYDVGDQQVRVNVWIPKNVSEEEKELLEKLRNSPNFQPGNMKEEGGFFHNYLVLLDDVGVASGQALKES
jgi:hypothetical protein